MLYNEDTDFSRYVFLKLGQHDSVMAKARQARTMRWHKRHAECLRRAALIRSVLAKDLHNHREEAR